MELFAEPLQPIFDPLLGGGIARARRGKQPLQHVLLPGTSPVHHDMVHTFRNCCRQLCGIECENASFTRRPPPTPPIQPFMTSRSRRIFVTWTKNSCGTVPLAS